MKKYQIIILVTLLTLVFSLTGCILLMRTAKRVELGQEIGPKKIAIVGNLIIDIPIEQTFKGTGKIFSGMAVNKYGTTLTREIYGPETDLYKDSAALFTARWNEYFAVTIPREKLYWTAVQIITEQASSSDTMLYLMTELQIDFQKEDAFIYIGDLVYYLDAEGNVAMRIDDRYENAKKIFSDYNLIFKGKRVILKKSLLTGDRKVEANLLKTTITYN
jgi:hypothetical protein